ncbi:MAG: hypothetical protein COV26_00505 [Candidatus Nealsonbacteria bacterium CG10_big_fil_rev_8_21_14_0_10_36_23]|uniref:Uncharacterized protein n=1 Tax=Candidatus Nealsonbacteria bacterium CG10_big_fil_rev_8_21_14_0_10_36_23 TaxID=1974709 RepID=A0A2H0TNC3_9BACT|nr:MAG: hypothetical protein COV26_00505 [Candidatus Nealsonbacteria bacterium CG10_big_fil_rev_8_21_14_0_10_36_23]
MNHFTFKVLKIKKSKISTFETLLYFRKIKKDSQVSYPHPIIILQKYPTAVRFAHKEWGYSPHADCGSFIKIIEAQKNNFSTAKLVRGKGQNFMDYS